MQTIGSNAGTGTCDEQLKNRQVFFYDLATEVGGDWLTTKNIRLGMPKANTFPKQSTCLQKFSGQRVTSRKTCAWMRLLKKATLGEKSAAQ